MKDVLPSEFDPVSYRSQIDDDYVDGSKGYYTAYDIYVNGDACEELDEDIYKTWFYFSV